MASEYCTGFCVELDVFVDAKLSSDWTIPSIAETVYPIVCKQKQPLVVHGYDINSKAYMFRVVRICAARANEDIAIFVAKFKSHLKHSHYYGYIINIRQQVIGFIFTKFHKIDIEISLKFSTPSDVQIENTAQL